jgi:hypothetical protein
MNPAALDLDIIQTQIIETNMRKTIYYPVMLFYVHYNVTIFLFPYNI